MADDQPILQLKDIHTYYGNIHALKGVSITIPKGGIACLIGANGGGEGHPQHAVTLLPVDLSDKVETLAVGVEVDLLGDGRLTDRQLKA